MSEHAARRAELLSRLGSGVAVLGAAPVAVRNGTTEHAYRQDSDFYYLTGIEEPGAVAVLTNRHAEHRYVLFVRKRDPERERYDGPRIAVEQAKELGADAAFTIEQLPEKLPAYLANAPRLMFALGRDRSLDQRVMAALARVRAKQRDGWLAPEVIVDPRAVLHPMRRIKSASELAAMSRAIEATAAAHRAAWAIARPGVYEHHLEAELLHQMRMHGAERLAYEPIVGSGPNATILHYRKNDRRIEPGELVLIDAGAEHGYQCADVTRTFPVEGRFSEPQRRIYDLVLRAQLRAIEEVRPGKTVEDVHREAHRVLLEGLIELGLVQGPFDEAVEKKRDRVLIPHRTSHWLGMDVHDVGDYFEHDEGGGTRPLPLEPGQVLTVEPGIYVAADEKSAPPEYRGIGVRIEDDVHVTTEGHRVLTADIPKEPSVVESMIGTSRP